jgi:hypothetical protein
MCVKCSKKVTDDSKICRDCGAILEDILDDSALETGRESKPEPPVRSPWTAKPWKPRQEACDEPIVDKPFKEPDKPSEPDTESSELDKESSAWKCPQCGESIPGTFDICWKCSTTRNGEKAEASESEYVQATPDASTSNEPSELTEDDDDTLSIEDDEEQTPTETVCLRCGSSRMMSGVTIQDQGQHSSGRLQVEICGVPSALIFKDRLHGELKANICGECGHVELRVANPRELYRHYRKSLR